MDAHDGSLRDVRAHVDVSSADAGVDAHRVMTGDAGQVNLLQNPGFSGSACGPQWLSMSSSMVTFSASTTVPPGSPPGALSCEICIPAMAGPSPGVFTYGGPDILTQTGVDYDAVAQIFYVTDGGADAGASANLHLALPEAGTSMNELLSVGPTWQSFTVQLPGVSGGGPLLWYIVLETPGCFLVADPQLFVE